MSNRDSILERICNLKSNPNIVNTYTENDIIEMLELLDHSYHSIGQSLVTDEQYDYLKDFLEQNYVTNDKVKKKIGSCEIGGDSKLLSFKKTIHLPHWMGSMNKIKNVDIKLFDTWKSKYGQGDSIVTDKLDGVSALLIFDLASSDIKLYTRGNGSIGQDISSLIYNIHFSSNEQDTIGYIQKQLKNNVVLRGELIINKNDFEELVTNKIIKDHSNSRNTVSGQVNAKRKNMDIVSKIKFVAYETIRPANLTPRQQLEYIRSLGINVVNNNIVDSRSLTLRNLEHILIHRRNESRFDIDGIVITENVSHEENMDGNPKHAFAFKMNTNEKNIQVTDVEWNISKDKYLIPIIHFEPIILNGVVLKKTSGFNAKFIVDNSIGKGSILTITRSGDVIPYVTNVVKFSDKPQLPIIPFEWTESNVHIKLNCTTNNADTEKLIKLKEFENMLLKLNFHGIGSKLASKLFRNGINTIFKLLSITKDNLLKIDGIKQKSAENILRSVNSVKRNLNMKSLMIASNCFGRGIGYKTIEVILNTFPNVLDKSIVINQKDLIKLKGIDIITAHSFLNNLDDFRNFVEVNKLEEYCINKLENPVIEQDNSRKKQKCTDWVVVFSGKRDSNLIDFITELGGKIDDNMSSKVTHLIMENVSKETTKKQYAMKHNINIYEVEDVKKMLGNL